MRNRLRAPSAASCTCISRTSEPSGHGPSLGPCSLLVVVRTNAVPGSAQAEASASGGGRQLLPEKPARPRAAIRLCIRARAVLNRTGSTHASKRWRESDKNGGAQRELRLAAVGRRTGDELGVGHGFDARRCRICI